MERKIKLVPYRVYKYCPKCPGIMEASVWGRIQCGPSVGITGTILTTSSSTTTTMFNHRCNKCGHGENYEKNYPYIDYIEDGDLEQ